MTWRNTLINFFANYQGISVLIFFILVVCVAVVQSAKLKLFFATILLAYGITAILLLARIAIRGLE